MDLVQKAINEETTIRRRPKVKGSLSKFTQPLTKQQEYAPIRRSKLTQLNSSAIVWSELDDEGPKDPRNKNNGIASFP